MTDQHSPGLAGALAISVFAVFSVLSPVKAQNLVANPGFETPYNAISNTNNAVRSGYVANSWYDMSAGATIDETYTQDTSAPNGGISDQKVTINSLTSGAWEFGQWQSVTAGQMYTATIWVKGSNYTGQMSFFIQQSTAPSTIFARTDFYPVSVPVSGWSQYALTFTAPTSTTVQLTLMTVTPGTFYIDDAQLVAATNVLANPGCETPYNAISNINNAVRTGYVANGWSDWSSGATINETYAQDTNTPHGGISDQKVTINSLTSGAWVFGQLRSITPGQMYTASIWVKGSNNTGQVSFYVQHASTPNNIWARIDFSPVSGWTQYALTFTAPTNGNVQFTLMSTHTGTICIDDASFVTVPNLAQNPGFESPYTNLPAGYVTGAVANGWYDNTRRDGGCNVTYAQDTNIYNSGASSQKITVNSGYSLLQQNVSFLQGSYSATFWIKASTPTSVSLCMASTNKTTVYGCGTFRATTNWTQVTVTGVTPRDLTGILQMRTAQSLTVGSVWVDDFTLTYQGIFPAAQAFTTPTSAIPATFFGLHPMNTAGSDNFILWPTSSSYTNGTVNFGVARTMGCVPKWAQIEPSRGTFIWSNLDAFVAQTLTNGQKVLYTFLQTPTWATADTKLDLYGYVGGAGVPSNMVYWTEFVTALVQRYGPQHQIMAYEIWNEPDTGWWDGTPAQMEAMEAAALPIIRANDSSALVLTAGITYGNTADLLTYYENYLVAGGGSNTDALACHLYDSYPENAALSVPALKALFSEYGLSSKPIWNTETGWGYSGPGTGVGQQDPSITIAYLAREYVINWALGIENFDWYAWSWMGNIGPAKDVSKTYKKLLKPGGIAYGQLYNWLQGSTMSSLAQDGTGNWVAVITRSGGYTGYIVWNNDTTFNYPKPVGVTQMKDLACNTNSLTSASNVVVGQTPILLDH